MGQWMDALAEDLAIGSSDDDQSPNAERYALRQASYWIWRVRRDGYTGMIARQITNLRGPPLVNGQGEPDPLNFRALQPQGGAHVEQPGVPSLTIFTIPKPFIGHIGVIQRNAITSWTRLCPRPDIVLCGDEPGVAEIAAELCVGHLPDLARNDYGTPYLHSTFEAVANSSDRQLLCYINADIMLLDDFVQALGKIEKPKFLLVGQRWDLDIAEPLSFDQVDWQDELNRRVREQGKPHSLWGIDYFVFPRRGVIDSLPPFVVGRPGWDNWVIYDARRHGIPVIDASAVIRAIHQNHDYSHVPMRWGERWVGPEAQHQIHMMTDLMAGQTMRFASIDATHRLTRNGVVRAMGLRSLRRRWETLPVLRPALKPLTAALNPPVRLADWLWKKYRAAR